MATAVVQVPEGPPVKRQAAALPLPPFASPQQLELFTKRKIKGAEPRVIEALRAVSAEIRREAGWHIWPVLEGHELVLDGSGGRVQPVPTLHLLKVNSVSSAGVAIPPEAVDFSRAGLLEIVGPQLWTRRYGQVLLNIDHGWEQVDELKGLCLSITARALASPLGATREGAGSLSVNWGMTSSVSGGIIPTAAELATVTRYKTLEV